MLPLSELADEYKRNAESLQKQIDSIEFTIDFGSLWNAENDRLRRKKMMLEEMLYEQMLIFNRLKNYYEK